MQASRWTPICALDDVVPNTGICALVDGDQVAVFRVGSTTQTMYATGNHDPNVRATVLSRGLIGNLGERIVVASPIYKQHFDLTTGECLEAPTNSVHAHATKVENGTIWVGV